MKYIELVEVYKNLESTTKRLEKTFIISEFLKKIPEDNLPETTLLLQGRVFPQWDERKIGVASRLVLKAINKSTGINTDKIEKQWAKIGDLGNVAEEFTKNKKQAFRLGVIKNNDMCVLERHRHRYEVNPNLVKILEKKGVRFSGYHKRHDGTRLMEFMELPNKKFHISTQSHPEFKSRLGSPSPLFYGFVKAILK